MHIAVLGNPESWYGRDLHRAATERGHQCCCLDLDRLIASIAASGSPLAGVDCDLTRLHAAVIRTMPPGSLEQVVFRMDALARLEAAGVSMLNPPKAIECAVDKYLTTWKLQMAGLPVPPTVVCERAETALEAFEHLGRDVVVKPLFGSEGRGMLRISDRELAWRTFRTLERIQAVLYLQQYIPHQGSDVRIVTLDGRILGGMKRRCRQDFRANVSQRGFAEAYLPSDRQAEWALRAAEITGARLAGVDLLQDRQGEMSLIEVNAVPGWRAFGRATGCDVAGCIIESLESDREKPS